MKQTLSPGALAVISELNKAGFRAYAIGGCVRDMVMGIAPHDYDVATSARPEQVQALFAHTVDTGSAFGTITVMMGTEPIEVTTFRKESGYKDGRHPSDVEFVEELQQDVMRRDFTVNGLAYHPDEGVIDLVEGLLDIERKRIRAIGNPNVRFDEDGLRILRAARFACKLDFEIDAATWESMERKKIQITNASVERIWAETKQILICKNGKRVGEFTNLLQIIFPELAPMMGFDQQNPYHHLSVWQHTLTAFANIAPELVLRTAILFHDCGKPLTFSTSADGRGHFYGHAEESEEMAAKALTRMRCERETLSRVRTLIKYHGVKIADDDRQVKVWLNKLGERDFFDLMAMKMADNSAKNPERAQRLMMETAALEQRGRRIIDQGECYQISQLAVGGDDLMALGMERGEALGDVLEKLLHYVMMGELPNDRQVLLAKAKEWRKE